MGEVEALEQAPSPGKPSPGKSRRRHGPGWVPNQHGAWAMIVIPPLAGLWLSGPSWRHVPLLGLWWIGYFAFFATGQWLRSRRKPRYWPPVRTYFLAMVPFALPLLITTPHLIVWALPFAPLMAITLWCSANRKDRSLLNDVVTLIAAGLLTPVAYATGVNGAGGLWGTGWLAGTGWLSSSSTTAVTSSPADGALAGWSWVWLVTLVITAYFIGTIFYVKTCIRERRSTGYLVVSIGYHAVWVAVVIVLATAGPVRWAHALVWVVLLARAWAVPLINRRRRITPKELGIGEIAASVAVLLTILL